MTSGKDLARMHTRHDLPSVLRERACELLNQRLAESIDLQTQCKQAHWNVKGVNFIALHELFDDINESVEEYVDLLAERVVQLAGVAQAPSARSSRARRCPPIRRAAPRPRSTWRRWPPRWRRSAAASGAVSTR